VCTEREPTVRPSFPPLILVKQYDAGKYVILAKYFIWALMILSASQQTSASATGARTSMALA
jgi:hypothetical protein